MTQERESRIRFSELRRRAESALAEKAGDALDVSAMSSEDVQELVHELQVRQIELEIRNEELRKACIEAEELKDKYPDVSEGKQAYDDLIRADQDWQKAFNAISDLVMILDDRHRIRRANKAMADALGVTEQELIGKHCFELVHGEKCPPVFCPHSKLLADGEEHSAEVVEPRLGGIYDVRVFPLAGQNGRVMGSLHVIHEITEQKRAEEQLIRSNKDLQQFAYVASHDLQEPLRNIAACLQMLEKKYKSKLDADADKYIHYAVDSAVRIKALIQDLLAYSRIATRGKPPGPIDCEQLLDQTVRNLRGAVVEAGAVITHDALPTIPGDDTQLLQVFQNLIGNAMKFRGNEPPKVHVSAVKNNNEWIFSVKDNGIGIESRHLDRIFVIFQRLHKRTEYDGTGMGLAMVKKVVERHGGRVWAESEPGQGTTFYFTIPRKRESRSCGSPLSGG